MKRILSFVMCIVMLMSVFTVLNVSTLAANGSDVMYVKQSVVKDGKITYTVYLNKGMKFTGVINHFKYDPAVLSPVSYKVLGDYADSFNYGGIAAAVGSGVYSVSAVMMSDSVWNSSENGTALMTATFKIIDSTATKLTMNAYCVEFNSPVASQNIGNNLEKPSLIGTLNSSALAPVQGVKAATGAGGIKVSWYATPNAAMYRVYRKVDGKWKPLKDVPASQTSYTDKTVSHNTSHTYAVRAFDANNLQDSGLGSTATAKYIMAPATFKAALVTNGIKVAWTGVSGATSYRIYRRVLNKDGTVGDWKNIYTTKKSSERNYTDKSGLSNNVRYQYVIRCVVGGLWSASYRVADSWYYAAPNVSLASVKGGIQIKWNKIAGAKNYRIYRRYSTSASWTVVKTVSAGTTSYIDNPNITVKKVYYTVKAYGENATGGYVQKSLSYVKTPTLKAPTNTSNSIKVSWSAIKGADGYIVYRKAGSATKWTKLATVKGTSYTDKNVKAGTNYTYTVKATSKKLVSGYDKTGVTVRRLAQPSLKKVVNNAAGINFTWGKVTGASGYKVYRKTGSGGWSLLGTVKTASFTDTKVTNGKTYTYTVRAVYGSSISSFNTKGLSIKCK